MPRRYASSYSPAANRGHERAKGTPAALVNVMTSICLAARLGLAAHVPPVLGREPRTLRAFLARSGPAGCLELKQAPFKAQPQPLAPASPLFTR